MLPKLQVFSCLVRYSYPTILNFKILLNNRFFYFLFVEVIFKVTQTAFNNSVHGERGLDLFTKRAVKVDRLSVQRGTWTIVPSLCLSQSCMEYNISNAECAFWLNFVQWRFFSNIYTGCPISTDENFTRLYF